MAIAAQPIIDALKAQANVILGTMAGVTFEGFQVGAPGNFPYYWQNPNDLSFNPKTYDWISLGLINAGPDTIGLGTSFTGTYLEALASVSYGLSTADQALLVTASNNATNQQGALLTAWNSIYGLPAAGAGMQPIDIILHTIATNWAQPATNLNAINNSTNLGDLLNNTPASGQPILNLLADYLNALGSAVSLQNASTMNRGYLQKAMKALQHPDKDNGGLSVGRGAGAVYHPAYQVSTAQNVILNALGSTASSSVSLKMTVTIADSSHYTVSVNGGTGFKIPFLDFFSFGFGTQVNYFSDTIATSSSSLTIDMEFSGVNFVNFGPVEFDLPTETSWYWEKPITDAIKNGNKDVSGFKFSPNPQIDFSKAGPFGYLDTVAICNHPKITVTAETASYNRIETDLTTVTSFGISFLGIPLGGGSTSTYSQTVHTDSSDSTVTITFEPPVATVGGAAVDSTAWVLGVHPVYPMA